MKKFFPLCLILIVALVWTVSIAGSDERAPTSNSEQMTQKALAIEKEKTLDIRYDNLCVRSFGPKY